MNGLLFGFAAIAVLAILAAMHTPDPLQAQAAEATVGNYLVYRQAAITYYGANPAAGPVVADSQLPLPMGYQQIRNWRNLRSGTSVYVYGPGDDELMAALVEGYSTSVVSVGRVTGGRLVSPVYGDLGVSVPSSIPDGSIAGVFKPN